ncbi:hypothetical protein PV11_06332 [Exophiala sideris]|uniref:Uncharacterized protein n=1 Tax=Exophiala sideris TaxID=1016849 RepID=A0A0D1Y758_9EURO|nr:hypothetical protein PV11_06332 [Exophiala sideris]
MANLADEAGFMNSSALNCEEFSTSSLYTMIPSLVRSRIPVLASFRQRVKGSGLQRSNSRKKAYTLSCIEAPKPNETYGFAATVPSSGASTPMIRPNTPEETLSSKELSLKMLQEPETSTSVDWDIAATGIRLWVTAKTQAEQGGDTNALRSMHIDALRYMHMALPPTLTPLEVESLRASMSPQLIYQPPPVQETQAERPPSILRQGVARAVCWVIAGIFLILPILMAFLNRILQYERQHQVTERVLINGLDFTSALGERGLEVQKALTRFKDGRVGSACSGAGSWFVEGIIGGVNDGIDAVAQNRRKAS